MFFHKHIANFYLESCDRFNEMLIHRHNQGLPPPRPDLRAIFPRPEIATATATSQTPTQSSSSNTVTIKTSEAKEAPVAEVEDKKAERKEKSPEKKDIATVMANQLFLNQHIKPEFQKLLNEMSAGNAVEKDFAAQVTDALVFKSRFFSKM